MTPSSIPSRVSRITELTRLIAGQLVLISPKSVVNFARTCRHIEEPALSTLWETQQSLRVLLEVLPEETLERGRLAFGEPAELFQLRIVGNPSPNAWNRVQRYASWMHRVWMSEWPDLGEDSFRKLRLNTPAGGWFPTLQDLTLCITKHTPLCTELLLSPCLRNVHITTVRLWEDPKAPIAVLPDIDSAISSLPASALQQLIVDVSHPWIPRTYLKDSLSFAVLRCGTSLTEFASRVPISDAAICHLIQLPRLQRLHIEGPPPSCYAASLPPVFPPLVNFTFVEGATPGWLNLLRCLEDGVSTTQDITPLHAVKESLKGLCIKAVTCPVIEVITSPVIDISFISPIRMFQSLVHLIIETYCHDNRGRGRCTFELNDDNATEIATSLTQLEDLQLGHPCFENTCATTVACLLPISVHCLELQTLQIHINTTNIISDLKNVLEGPEFEQLRSLPRCTLWCLDFYQTPLSLDGPGFEAVANGMVDIFPSLESCDGRHQGWYEVTAVLDLRE